MASHVVVIDSTARRAMVKTMPNKHLSDVLEEACAKLGLKSSQYGLKNNNKTVDLSRTIRLSGLTSGAKLELVQLSKSAGVVSVALQLPESDAQGVPNARLTDKFPSTTTLWLILRKFEAGVAGGGGNKNLTAKAAPAPGQGKSGSGRLYYQQPVIQVMNRELASFTDLQKSLAQLGLNNGSALLRLSYRASTTPLEDAMMQIQAYFDSTEPASTLEGSTQQTQPPPSISSPAPAEQTSIPSTLIEPSNPSNLEPGIDSSVTSPSIPIEPPAPLQSPEPDELVLTSSNRPISVFRPPTSSTPVAAVVQPKDSDFTPTIEHAQTHQRMLNQASHNKRLATDAELAAQASSEAEKLASIKEVEIKVRFPDESAVSSKFGQIDTAESLYNFVRTDCLESKWSHEPFVLRYSGLKGPGQPIPVNDSSKRLIRDLQLKGRVLVIFGWDDTKASPATRQTKQVLKQELRVHARDIPVPDVLGTAMEEDDPGVKVGLGKKGGSKGGDEDGSGSGAKKLPKWLNRLSKK